MRQAVLQKIQRIGSVSCPQKEFAEIIGLIASGMIDPEKYVTEVQALEQQTDPQAPMVKFVIRP